MPSSDQEQERTEPSGEGTARRYTYMVPALPDTIGDALRRDRLAKDLDQAEVAVQMGFHQSKLSAYELGKIKHPPPDRLRDLARLYGRPDNYYLEIGGWPSGAELLRWREEIANCLVTRSPRDGLQDLVEMLQALSPPAFRRVFLTVQEEWAWQQENPAAAMHRAPARDSA